MLVAKPRLRIFRQDRPETRSRQRHARAVNQKVPPCLRLLRSRRGTRKRLRRALRDPFGKPAVNDARGRCDAVRCVCDRLINGGRGVVFESRELCFLRFGRFLIGHTRLYKRAHAQVPCADVFVTGVVGYTFRRLSPHENVKAMATFAPFLPVNTDLRQPFVPLEEKYQTLRGHLARDGGGRDRLFRRRGQRAAAESRA